MKKARGEKVCRPVHPNAGIGADYQRSLVRFLYEMHCSYVWWIKAQYRKTPPRLAMDATKGGSDAREGGSDARNSPVDARKLAMDAVPARELQRELALLGKRWEDKINAGAPKLAQWFAKSNSRRSEAGLKKILADAGMTVDFKMSPKMKDAYEAVRAENVGLIRSIAEQYHSQVEGLVMRSVSTGRDLSDLTSELQERFGISKRRAAHIALDQNNKATAVFVRVRQTELGLKARWLHSTAGKVPRKTHLANTGKLYDPAKGWFDPDPKVKRRIWPGELINCRCVSRSVVKGFS